MTRPTRAFSFLLGCAGGATALLLAPDASAQTLLTLEGTFPSGGEFSIHPPNSCGYPKPGAFVWFLPDFTSSCGLIQTFPPPATGLLGDSANDVLTDTQWMTDGLTLVGYQGGVAVSTWVIAPGTLFPNPITGIGFDSETSRMWLTDGASALAIQPPSLGCSPAPSIVVPAFALPTSGVATDIEWDSWSDTLWIVDDLGVVTNVSVGGAVGPFGFFTPSSCALVPPLTGIAFDTGTGNLFIGDGSIFEYVDRTGAPAAPTFYAPNAPCASPPPPGPPALLSGLAFSPRPQKYGVGCATIGSVPEIGHTGSFSVTPNPSFGVTLTGAVPNTPVALVLGLDSICTAFTWGVCELLTFPFLMVVPNTTNGAGDVNQPLPIPALPPGSSIVGVTVKSQWLVFAAGGRQTSNGMSFTICTR